MAVTLTSGERQRAAGTFQAVSVITCTSATHDASLGADCITLSAGTGTQSWVDLADGVEGQEMTVVGLATSTLTLLRLTGTATGGFAFTTAGQFLVMKYINAAWRLITSNATIGTTT